MITIGIPTYNSEKTIVDLLESLRNQTYLNFSVFISDNNSSDDTIEIVQAYCSFDNRFKLIRNDKNIGSTRNLIRLVDLAETDYFCWLPSDVKLDQKYLDALFFELENDPTLVGSYTGTYICSKNNTRSYFDEYELTSDITVERIGVLLKNLSLGTAVYGLYRTKILKKVFILSCINPWHDNKVFQFGDLIMLMMMLFYGKIKQVKSNLLLRNIDDNLKEIGSDDRYFQKIETYQMNEFPVLSLPFICGIVKAKRIVLESEIAFSEKVYILKLCEELLVHNKLRINEEIELMTKKLNDNKLVSFSNYANQKIDSVLKMEPQFNLLLRKEYFKKILFDLRSLDVYIDDVEVKNKVKNIAYAVGTKIKD